MSLFSSFLVLLLILVEAAPPTASSVPKLGLYYCFNMVLIMTSIFLSSLVVNINKRGDQKKYVPRWLKVLVLEFLARLMAMKRCCCDQHSSSGRNCRCSCSNESKSPKRDQFERSNVSVKNQETAHMLSQATNDPQTVLLDLHLPDRDSGYNAICNNVCSANDKLPVLERYFSQIESFVKDLRKDMKHVVDTIDRKAEQTRESRRCAADWREVSRVLDRFFVILYLLTIICSLVTLFPWPLRNAA